MRELLLIRHGAAAGNLEHRYLGRTDQPLCPEGAAQVLALKERLRERGMDTVDALFVSSLLRARQTAALLFPEQRSTVLPGLRETDFGVFEGKTADIVSRVWSVTSSR